MNYSLKIDGKATEVYKCYTAAKLWVATIRHYDDKEAIRKLIKEYGDKIAIITKSDKIIWDIRQNFKNLNNENKKSDGY